MNVQSLFASLLTSFHKVGRYAIILFVLFLAFVYGFLLYRINVVSSAEPSDTAITQANTPRVDKTVVKQLLDLKDNSVTVQTLFDEARSNPFQE